jgi:rhodanese-related sulfurtransferase
VKTSTAPSAAPGRKAEVRKVLLESALVAAIGAAFALAANQVSPRGLALTRNYFPGATRPLRTTMTLTNRLGEAATTNAPATPVAELLAARLKAQGLQLLGSNEVAQLFRDPRYEQELVVFVDARDDRHYQEGHVPGAYQLDHYRVENYLAVALPVCQTADQIVVYCDGGGCEDSEFTALTLSDAGIPKAKLFVYGGGMTEWITNGLPTEIGSRKSGNLRNATR